MEKKIIKWPFRKEWIVNEDPNGLKSYVLNIYKDKFLLWSFNFSKMSKKNLQTNNISFNKEK